jgi:glycosyltransferase involved in cell wall biosynthesis
MPKVSIGLPVYNGADYVEEAIASVLCQTFEDLELVVCDNASTDRTADICRAAEAADRRVRYLRNDRNLGAAPNYNRVWAATSGEYFKWIAHDDRIKPRYIAMTLAALEAEPAAVLCNTVIDHIDAAGEHLGYYRSVLAHCNVPQPASRLAALTLQSHTALDFFGLMRRRSMEASLLHQAYHNADRAFLAQMALRGRLLQLDEPLIEMREHQNRYTRRTKTNRAKAAWHDTRKAGAIEVPAITLYRAYRHLVETEALSDRDRAECRAVLRRFWLNGLNLGRLAADLLSVPFPTAATWAFKLRYKLFGAPGNFLR